MTKPDKDVRAALLIIGSEILSGRTQDINLNHIANQLNQKGIRMMECRIIADIEDEIIAAVNALRSKYDYVFTTGGIGPTHDDITALSIAKAFGQKLIKNQAAYALMAAHYKALGVEFTQTRSRMAYTPEFASLIDNPVSVAPGFQVENVFVMAGVPKIMQAMLENVIPTLTSGTKLLNAIVLCNLPEGEIALGLAELQNNYPKIDIGSYPSFDANDFKLSLVLRGTDEDMLKHATKHVVRLIEELKGEWQCKIN